MREAAELFLFCHVLRAPSKLVFQGSSRAVHENACVFNKYEELFWESIPASISTERENNLLPQIKGFGSGAVNFCHAFEEALLLLNTTFEFTVDIPLLSAETPRRNRMLRSRFLKFNYRSRVRSLWAIGGGVKNKWDARPGLAALNCRKPKPISIDRYSIVSPRLGSSLCLVNALSCWWVRTRKDLNYVILSLMWILIHAWFIIVRLSHR